MRLLGKIISVLLATVMLFGAVPTFALSQHEGSGRVYFYNISGESAPTADFILIESDGHYGLIDTGHRYDDHIVDSDGTVYYCDPSPTYSLSCQQEGRNGRDAVKYFAETLGVRHLDFIVATHSHSDHIGGVPEIASLVFDDGNGEYSLVDENTVYFYKQYYHTNGTDDDLGDDTDDTQEQTEGDVSESDPESQGRTSWHNQAYFYQAVNAMQNRQSVLAELSQGISFEETEEQSRCDYSQLFASMRATGNFSGMRYITDSQTSYYDDCLSFYFGNFNIRLYNLYNHHTTRNENVNSIVTAITDGQSKLVSLADINVEDRAEQKLAQAVADDIGRADVVKMSHHGIYSGSNSRGMLDALKPVYAVATRRWIDVNGVNQRGAYAMAMTYAKEKYNTVFYEAGCSENALVTQFNDEGVEFYNLRGSGDEAYFDSADGCIGNLSVEDGWQGWTVEWGDTSIIDYYYYKDSKMFTGWLKSEGEWYHFSEDGLMNTGFQTINGTLMYFNGSGRLQHGWKELDGNWYYMGNDGIVRTGWVKIYGKWYLFSNSGVMQTGWVKDNGKWYYFGDDGRMKLGWVQLDGEWYYFGNDGAMRTLWQKVNNKWYYMNKSGVMQTGWEKIKGYYYYFDDNGVMQTGWVRYQNNWYYLYSNGRMATGRVFVNGRMYHFALNGKMI